MQVWFHPSLSPNTRFSKVSTISRSSAPPAGPSSANKAQAAQTDVEGEERVDCEADPVLDDAAAAEDAHAGGQGPGHEHDVDGDPGDLVQIQRREEGGDDEGEEGVSDDADALGEGAIELFVLARVGQ